MLITRFISRFALAAAFLTAGHAAPLSETKLSPDAKWVLHLDLDAFRQTKLGKFIVDEIVDRKFSEAWRNALAQGGQKFEFDTSLAKIQSVTAFGSAFGKEHEGVLMVRTTANVKKDIEALVGMAALDGNENTEIFKVADSSFLLYKINDDAFVAPDVNGTVLLARTQDQVERARAMLLGEKESISGADLFPDYPTIEQSFFFLGAAEGFSHEGPMPPQAQVLQESDGGRLVIGESGEHLFLNLVLRGKNPESTTKIQQVLQGIVALVSMAQDNPDLQQLASATTVNQEAQNVIVNLKIPVARAIDKIKEKQTEESSEEEDKSGEP